MFFSILRAFPWHLFLVINHSPATFLSESRFKQHFEQYFNIFIEYNSSVQCQSVANAQPTFSVPLVAKKSPHDIFLTYD